MMLNFDKIWIKHFFCVCVNMDCFDSSYPNQWYLNLS